jgi:hypothetical protein
MAGVPDALSWAIAASAGFLLRGAAIYWGLAIPAYGRNQS